MACLDHPFEHPSVQGRNPSDSNEAGGTPQEARIREEVHLTLVKLENLNLVGSTPTLMVVVICFLIMDLTHLTLLEIQGG